MANARRGEIAALLGGRERRLVLTLGALAELESAFGVEGLSALGERFETGRLRARDLAAILGAGLRGAGELVTDEEAGALAHPEGLPGYVRVVAELFAATFGEPPREILAASSPPRP
jgi:hypothetical protein